MVKSVCRVMVASICVFAISLLINLSVYAQEKPKGKGSPSKKSLQQRIDFSSSQILGQSIKSGAVYLMHRKQSDIEGMLKVRQDYRNEIMEDYGLEKTAITKTPDEKKKKK